MYELLRRCHGMLDRFLARLLSAQAMRAYRAVSQKVANKLFPGRLRAANARELEALDRSQPWIPPRLPDWVREELAEISRDIDPALHPQGEWVSAATFYSAPWTYSLPGDCYFDFKAQLPPQLDVAIIVPWLQSGGADLGAIHFANTLSTHFGQRVAVIATEDAPSPWRDRLAAGVSFLATGAALSELDEQHRIDVLVRLLLQTSPRVIHVMNSRLAWEAVERNGLALRQYSRIFASLYCDDITEHGQPVGYARSYLGSCHAMLDGVISDNPVTPMQWCRQMGVREDLFHVVRFPAPQADAWPLAGQASAPVGADDDPRPHVLWAGRMDRQKRPDLLARIAQQMPEFVFDVHGGAVMDRGLERQLKNIPNIRLHGPYQRFADLRARGGSPIACLYTAAWGSLPNVLLEAANAGLPIVAADVGGIADFLDEAQRVQPHDDVQGYVTRLRLLAQAPEQAQAWRQRQLARLRQAHSIQSFVQSIAALPGYLEPTAGFDGQQAPLPAATVPGQGGCAFAHGSALPALRGEPRFTVAKEAASA